MNNNVPSQKVKKSKKSFWEIAKLSFTSPKARVFPWLQTGLVLFGFASGVLVTTFVDLASRIVVEDKKVVVAEEDKCRAQGGRYDSKNEICLLVPDDRGSSCDANSDCKGWCLANENAELGNSDKGVCSENYNPSGCFKYMDDGMVNEICLP